MQDKSALVPDSYQIVGEPIQDSEPVVVAAAETADKEVAALLTSKGWQRLSQDMKADIDYLRNLRGADIAGLSMDKVGEKFLVASLVADHLQKYLEKVDNAAKAVADAERAKRPN